MADDEHGPERVEVSLEGITHQQETPQPRKSDPIMLLFNAKDDAKYAVVAQHEGSSFEEEELELWDEKTGSQAEDKTIPADTNVTRNGFGINKHAASCAVVASLVIGIILLTRLLIIVPASPTPPPAADPSAASTSPAPGTAVVTNPIAGAGTNLDTINTPTNDDAASNATQAYLCPMHACTALLCCMCGVHALVDTVCCGEVRMPLLMPAGHITEKGIFLNCLGPIRVPTGVRHQGHSRARA